MFRAVRLYAVTLLLLLAGASSGEPAPGRAWGLFIGISGYPEMGGLAYCAEDARRMASFFATREGALRVDPGFAKVLADSAATLEGVRKALRALARSVHPEDVVVIYFSGHGGGEDEPDAPPRDEPDGHDETLVMWDSTGPHEEDLSDDDLKQLLRAISCRSKILLLDACFSGGFVRDLAGDGTLVFAACQEDGSPSVAYVHRVSGGFTHALFGGLSGEADLDRDGWVTERETREHLARVVPLYCQECGRRNPPQSTRCYYDRETLGRRSLAPRFGGTSGLASWVRVDPNHRPERCSTGEDRALCRRNPEKCACTVRGECGEEKCMAAGRKIVDACATDTERALCRQNPTLCPCPSFGNCGEPECANDEVCQTEKDRAQCGRDPQGCPCGHYGDCAMDSCRESRATIRRR